jgi:hypothetical protein
MRQYLELELIAPYPLDKENGDRGNEEPCIITNSLMPKLICGIPGRANLRPFFLRTPSFRLPVKPFCLSGIYL